MSSKKTLFTLKAIITIKQQALYCNAHLLEVTLKL
jgi:hypothetical protein